jgi:hypothetical protein
MKVVIQKPDLDTCLTGLILGVSDADEIVVRLGNASQSELDDPAVICIEAGGSGQTELNNFDHHDVKKSLPPACRQAFVVSGSKSREMERLVDYVCKIDEGCQDFSADTNLCLSKVFSGLPIVEKGRHIQFLKGIDMLRTVISQRINPFEILPVIDDWKVYIDAEEQDKRNLERDLKRAIFYTSRGGLKVGYLESKYRGGSKALYDEGCDVVIMFNSSFEDPPVRKYTIAGNNIHIAHLLMNFDQIERGWGGSSTGTIIGSPREVPGSGLSAEHVIKTVIDNI